MFTRAIYHNGCAFEGGEAVVKQPISNVVQEGKQFFAIIDALDDDWSIADQMHGRGLEHAALTKTHNTAQSGKPGKFLPACHLYHALVSRHKHVLVAGAHIKT
jgi:hypothetical protein